jgi:ectoine hydroxylase-related dioxygenase (phytanoyl-CoA dioxygenase family)
MKQFPYQLKNDGYCIISNSVDIHWRKLLIEALEKAFIKHRQIQINNDNDIMTEGVALHVILNDSIFISFLEDLIDSGLMDYLKYNYFKSNFILNSFSGLNNLPNQQNFSSTIHRDLRFYTGEIPVMINALVMLDDFTEDNGPTLLLPGSHLKEDKPSDEYFHNNAIKVIAPAGSILLFNSNVWHCSSPNTSNKGRRALPMTFTKSLIKQLLDYPRALGYDRMKEFSEPLQQLLGYHARIPANLEEWYQPFENRFYKKNQD